MLDSYNQPSAEPPICLFIHCLLQTAVEQVCGYVVTDAVEYYYLVGVEFHFLALQGLLHLHSG